MYSSVRPYKILQKVKRNENNNSNKKTPNEAKKETTEREDNSKKNTIEKKKKYEDLKYYECNRKSLSTKRQDAEGRDKITKNNKTNHNADNNHVKKSQSEKVLKKKEDMLITLLKKEQSCVHNKKIIIRHLPPTLSEDNFFDSFPSNLKDELDYYYYVNGCVPKNAGGDITHSRMYLSFKDDLKTKEFIKTQHGKFFYDSNGGKFKAMVSFAPYQTIIHKNKSDDMNNTLESDAYFLKCCEEMNNPEEPVKKDEDNGDLINVVKEDG
ncbi:mRNA decay protein, partial [Plasmodium cynomolgi strain B]